MRGSTDSTTNSRNPEEVWGESELRFRSVVESATDAVILTDDSGKILTINEATHRIFGYGEDLIGQSLYTLLPLRYRKAPQDFLAAFSTDAESPMLGKTIEMHGRKKDGSEFPLELSLATWNIGGRSFYCGTIHDTTRREQAEIEALKRTAEVQVLQDVAVASNEATSVDEAIQFAVDRICAFTNWPVGHVYFPVSGSDEILSSSIWHLNDAQKYEPFRKMTEELRLTKGEGLVGQVLATGDAVWVSNIVRDSNFGRGVTPSLVDLKSAFAFPVKVDGEVVASLEFFSPQSLESDQQLIEIIRHVGAMLGRVFERQSALSRLRHAESSSRQLVESIQAIIWRGNPEYRFTFVSKEAEQILGYPASNWIDPDFWAEHIHAEDRSSAVAYGLENVRQRKDHSFDFRMIAADGRTVWFRNVVRVISHNDQPIELVGVMIDITRQKESEEQVRKSREQLRALSAHLQYIREEERTRIAREIHDELGQVLTALKMDLSLLNHGLLESSESMPRFRLMEEIASMRRLVDRTIQTVRRISTELRPEVLDHLDLRAAMEWQIQEFQVRSGIICEFRSNVDAIEIDRDSATALFRIFQEAMTNVARHANASRVNIGLMQIEDSLLMEVSDNGRGITESNIANARSFGILGIKERALLLGGEVEIKGSPGQGTTLSVRVSYPSSNSKGR